MRRLRCPKPECFAGLNGGPVRYTCDDGHGVSAADLYQERTEITDPIVWASARGQGVAA